MSGDTTTTAPEWLRSHVREVPDFPQPGVRYRDITPLLADGATFQRAVDELTARFEGATVDRVVGVESRGFIVAAPIAYRLGASFIPVRKAGKLPPPVVSRRYDLEYGSATIEVPTGVLDGAQVLLVDDVLATGGTLRAAAELITQAGGTVAAMAVIVELGALGGRGALGDAAPLHALLTL